MRVIAAVAYEGRDRFTIEELELSEPGPNDILVRIAGVGLCHTDVKALEGSMRVPKPVVLGHEGAGIVERVGERVTKVKPGDYVVLTYDSCGSCRACAGGDPAYCEQTGALNFRDARENEPGFFHKGNDRIHGHFFGQSSFADYAIARAQNTIPVRKDAPLEILGVLGCSVQTGAGAIMNSLAAKSGEGIAIFGVGPVGLSAVMAAVVCGCAEIVAIDVLESRLAMAKQLGATHCVLAGPNVKTAEEVRRLVPGGVNVAFDTTGRADSYQQAIASLATKGRFGFVTVPAGEFKANLGAMMLGGLTIRGIVQGDSVPGVFIPPLIDLYMSKRFPFDKLVTKYPFEQINQAIEDQASGKVVKPVFTFGS
ncbi:MAG TPA: NAD(P)-dependent alcohol dehydrogenase [Candidatus Acidoferrales bacterium]|nr:NAD(P)-dependent alcohol dehydrogenase [Candidatus Acidoferrales bacterium]